MGNFSKRFRRQSGDAWKGDEAQKDRLHLLEFNDGNVRAALQLAASDSRDVRDSVVMLVDARDPVGIAFMTAVAPEEIPKANETLRGGQIPTFTASIPRLAAVEGFKDSQPNISKRLESRPPDGHFWVCVVASGGVLLAAPGLAEGQVVGDA